MQGEKEKCFFKSFILKLLKCNKLKKYYILDTVKNMYVQHNFILILFIDYQWNLIPFFFTVIASYLSLPSIFLSVL